MNNEWTPAPSPASGGVQLRVVFSGGTPTNTSFHLVTKRGGVVVHEHNMGGPNVASRPGGVWWCMTPQFPSRGQMDGTLEVTATVTYSYYVPGPPPAGGYHTGTVEYGPSSFELENLRVATLTASGETEGGTIEACGVYGEGGTPQQDGMFLLVPTEADVTVTADMGDGSEIPAPAAVQGNLLLRRLRFYGAGAPPPGPGYLSGPAQASNAPATLQATFTAVPPGLYFVDVDSMTDGDGATPYSSWLASSGTEVAAFLYTGARQGKPVFGTELADASSRQPKGHLAVCADPTRIQLAEVALERTPELGADEVPTADAMSFEWAGDYDFAMTFKDDHANDYGDKGGDRWSEPKAATLAVGGVVAAAACDWHDSDPGPGVVVETLEPQPAFGTAAAEAWDHSGDVLGTDGTRGFYSAPPGRPSGLLHDPTAQQFLDALGDPVVRLVQFAGHADPDRLMFRYKDAEGHYHEEYASPSDIPTLSNVVLVMLLSCRTDDGDDTSMGSMFVSKGADAVIGFRRSVYICYAADMIDWLWKCLTQGDPDPPEEDPPPPGGLTVAEAVAATRHRAQTTMGANYYDSGVVSMQCLPAESGVTLWPAIHPGA